jgi:ABC-type sulfate transport system permease component
MVTFISGGGLTAARCYGVFGLILFISGGGLKAARCCEVQALVLCPIEADRRPAV